MAYCVLKNAQLYQSQDVQNNNRKGDCQTMNPQNTKSNLLRRALEANGAFSALSGIILIVASKRISVLIGVNAPSILIGIGISILVYAAVLFRNARRPAINQTEAILAVILDGTWVVGSAILTFAGVLSTTGNWVTAVVADIVLLFGVLQVFGIRKLRQEMAG